MNKDKEMKKHERERQIALFRSERRTAAERLALAELEASAAEDVESIADETWHKAYCIRAESGYPKSYPSEVAHRVEDRARRAWDKAAKRARKLSLKRQRCAVFLETIEGNIKRLEKGDE